MENQDAFIVPPETSPQKGPGILAKIFKVFYQPSGVFGFLTKKTEWIIPFVLMIIVSSILGYLIQPIMMKERSQIIYAQIEKYKDRMSEEQYNQTMTTMQENLEKERGFKITSSLTVIIFLFVLLVIITVISLVTGNFVFGGKANFWIVMNAIAFAGLVGLLGDIVRDLMALAKGTTYIYTGLGLLKPIEDSSMLYYFLKQIDVFSIWRLIVASIGLGIVYKMKPVKFGYVLFGVWIIVIVLFAFLNTYSAGSLSVFYI